MSTTVIATRSSTRTSRRKPAASSNGEATSTRPKSGRTLSSVGEDAAAVAARKAADPFAHLPPYSPPKTGLVSRLPLSLVPYAELMRLHKPAGFYAFYFPHVFGTLFAAAVAPSAPAPSTVLSTLLVHLVGNLMLRGGACTYNDGLDGPFDRLVERCRHRPVARGAVSPSGAQVFAAAQTAAWIAVLACLPRECHASALLFAATMVLYPWCKRFTNFPQVVLGFSLALGQGIGAASIGLDPFDSAIGRPTQAALACLYMSNVCNAIVYDTVYAHQDLKDDLKAGVMGMAVACNGHTREVLSVMSAIEIAFLAGAGYLAGFGPAFWTAGVGGTAAVLVWMISVVDFEVPADCWRWFKWTIWFTGATLSTGLAGEYAMRVWA